MAEDEYSGCSGERSVWLGAAQITDPRARFLRRSQAPIARLPKKRYIFLSLRNLRLSGACLVKGLMLTTFLACEMGGGGGDDDIVNPSVDASPWMIPLEVGNFEVNGDPVALWEGSESLGHIEDCAPATDFPDGSLRTFRIQVFVPNHRDRSLYVTTLNDVKAHVDYASRRTGNIIRSWNHVRSTTLDFGAAKRYNQFELVAAVYVNQDIVRDTFAAIVFSFEVRYTRFNSSGPIVDVRDTRIEVFARDSTRACAEATS